MLATAPMSSSGGMLTMSHLQRTRSTLVPGTLKPGPMTTATSSLSLGAAPTTHHQMLTSSSSASAPSLHLPPSMLSASSAFSFSSSSSSSSSSPSSPPSSASSPKTRRKKKISPRRNRTSQAGWTAEEDALLTKIVKKQKGRNWKLIASYLKNRKPEQCLHRWQKVLNPTLTKGLWSSEEDRALEILVQQHGPKRWALIASHLDGRNGKQCRERWHNHLDPTINKLPFNKHEDHILLEAHASVGNKWALIASLLPGRTHNAVKNRWHSSLKHFCTPPHKQDKFANNFGSSSRQPLTITDYYLTDSGNSSNSSSTSTSDADDDIAVAVGRKRKRSNSSRQEEPMAIRMNMNPVSTSPRALYPAQSTYPATFPADAWKLSSSATYADQLMAEAREYLDNWR